MKNISFESHSKRILSIYYFNQIKKKLKFKFQIL